MLIVRIQLTVITAFIASTNVLARGWGQEFWYNLEYTIRPQQVMKPPTVFQASHLLISSDRYLKNILGWNGENV